MTKAEWLARVGSMQQVAYVRPAVHADGRAKGMRTCLVKSGALSFEVLADKCLDIGEFCYKGTGLHFLAKTGLLGPTPYDTHGETQRSIMGGLLFTSGLENICAPCETGGKQYPLHGRLRTTPAEHLCTEAAWRGDEYHLSVSGEMREAELFGENLVLRRTISTVLGEKAVHIRDEFTNEGFREEPMMLLYHFNFGWPLLAPGARVVLPSSAAHPRDEAARPHVGSWPQVPGPKPGEPEYVYLHELKTDADGNTFAAVVNEALGLGVKLEFNQKHLPYFMQWSSAGAGDYALGLEPANASVYGRPWHENRGDLHTLPPLGAECIELTVRVLEGEEELRALLNL